MHDAGAEAEERIDISFAEVPATEEFKPNSTNDVCERKFIFAEFFSGMGGLSEAVKFVAPHQWR